MAAVGRLPPHAGRPEPTGRNRPTPVCRECPHLGLLYGTEHFVKDKPIAAPSFEKEERRIIVLISDYYHRAFRVF